MVQWQSSLSSKRISHRRVTTSIYAWRLTRGPIRIRGMAMTHPRIVMQRRGKKIDDNYDCICHLRPFETENQSHCISIPYAFSHSAESKLRYRYHYTKHTHNDLINSIAEWYRQMHVTYSIQLHPNTRELVHFYFPTIDFILIIHV